MSLAWILVLTALGVGLVVLLLGVVDPLTARLGLRNVLRHRRQTLTVVIGLLAGTAVIGASLVTGDSLEHGLRQTAIDAVDETDLVVRVPGNLFVPEDVFAAVAAGPLPARVDGASSIVLESAAVEHRAEDLYEPGAAVIGFDPAADRPFGAFRDAETGERVYGEELGREEVYLNARLAATLEAAPGDELELTYQRSFVPFVPRLTWLNGTLVAATATPDGAGGQVYAHSPFDVYESTVQVPRGSVGILAIVAWPDPANTTDLDLELVAPDGAVFRATNGSVVPPAAQPVPLPLPPPVDGPVAAPENPAYLFVDRANTSAGEWTLRVHGKNARDQPFTSVAAVLVPEYDLESASRFYTELSDRFGAGIADALDPASARGTAASTTVRVARVVAMEGKGVFFNADVVFMEKSAAQRLYGLEGRANWLKVTHVGGPEAGLAGTPEVVSFFEQRIDGLQADPGDLSQGAVANLEVVPLKADFVAQTEEAARLFTQFLTLIGSFTLIAGVMLIVNIFSMLAEERRHELGIARAVGLTRRRLVTAFTFEGSIYTLAASALGVLVGMGLAAFLVWGIDSLSPEGSLFRVPYRAEPVSLAVAFAAGSLLTFATVVFASWRAAHLDIVRAIRDLDADPGAPRRLWPRVAVLAVMVGATLMGVLFGSHLALAIGPALVAWAVAPVVGRTLRSRAAWAASSLFVILYSLVGFVVLTGPEGLERDVATVARGVLMVIAATILFVQWDVLPRGLAWVLRRSRRFAPIASVAMTYPLHRRFRTGLTLSMYSLVLFVIVVFSVFFTMFTPDLTRESGGYDVVADSQVPTPRLDEVAGVAALDGTEADPFRGVERYDYLAEHFEFGEGRVLLDGERPSGFAGNSARFVGFDADFAEANRFPLAVWDDRFATEGEVYAAVATDPTLVLVSYSLVGNLSAPDGRTHGPGSTLTINTTVGRSEHTIVGVMEQTMFGGVWMQRAEVERRFPQHEGMYLFRLQDDVDATEAAKRIERAFRGIGMDATAIETEAAELQAETNRIYQLFQAYLALGLIVGVASIGIVTSRAVLERRREIGMLKAIGFTRGMVAGAFLVEVLFVLVIAALIGIGMGLAVARAIFEGQLSVVPGVTWMIPWGRIAEMLGLALIATLIATLWPARSAAAVPAAEALRTTE